MKLFNKMQDQSNKVARQNAFSVYDEKAKAYNLPFFYSQIGLAIRAFKDSVAAQNSVVARHPEDFTLYHIGTFDDVTGKMESFVEPQFVARGSEIVEQLKQEALKKLEPKEIEDAPTA